MKKQILKKTKEDKIVKKTKKLTVKKVATKSAKKVAPKKVLITSRKKSTASKVVTASKHVISVSKNEKKKKLELPVKKLAYILLAMFGGLLVGVIMNAFVEFIFIKQMMESGVAPIGVSYFGYSHFLPSFTEFLFLFFGLLIGMWLGILGWDLVYVQGKHYKKWFK
jgi:DNA-directed RNA polymerase beta' subunit